MGIVADTSVYTNTPGPNAAEGLETLRQNQLALMEQVGFLPPQDLSIADGVISPTRGSIVVDTEGGAAADDLTVINPTLSDQTTLHDGMIVELIAKDDARTITVKHGTGQNNISLVEQADIVLSTKWSLRLQWDAQSAIWRQRLFSEPLKAATASLLGGIKVGAGLSIGADGTLSVDPWNAFPLWIPVGVMGVKFGGTDGRRAIMPGELEPRENWIKCDGGADGKGGTVPNLQGRVILGASEEHEAGSTGGSEEHSHSLSGTVGQTTLSVAQMPSHTHGITVVTVYNGAGTGYEIWQGRADGNTKSTGGSLPHTHDLTGSVGNCSSLPPYYSLSIIMRVS